MWDIENMDSINYTSTSTILECKSFLMILLQHLSNNQTTSITYSLNIENILELCVCNAPVHAQVFNITSSENMASSSLLNVTESVAYDYDPIGAKWFIVITLGIYALSIVIMIASALSRSVQDDEVKTFLESYSKLDIKKYDKRKVSKLFYTNMWFCNSDV